MCSFIKLIALTFLFLFNLYKHTAAKKVYGFFSPLTRLFPTNGILTNMIAWYSVLFWTSHKCGCNFFIAMSLPHFQNFFWQENGNFVGLGQVISVAFECYSSYLIISISCYQNATLDDPSDQQVFLLVPWLCGQEENTNKKRRHNTTLTSTANTRTKQIKQGASGKEMRWTILMIRVDMSHSWYLLIHHVTKLNNSSNNDRMKHPSPLEWQWCTGWREVMKHYS